MAVMTVRDVDVRLGGRPILSQVSLPPLQPGRLTALIGPNAAGKSTLLRALIGAIPARGTIAIDGTEVRNIDRHTRRGLLSYMPQAVPQGSSLSPYELARSYARATELALSSPDLDRRIAELFSMLGLMDDAHRPMQVLSGGKRQLVGLCLTVIHQPAILLLDEPTSALDLHWQLAAISMVRGYLDRNGATAVMALHDVNLALRFSDEIAVLKHGRLVAAGAPADIVSPDLIAEVYGVAARVETCSAGFPVLLADRPTSTATSTASPG
ncbi:ABC transporter ATP-binding protein [Rhodobium gokarnense]|uniref:Iron complex transport system ATP-binding protein n=1 Tax=Rhodobium gokarnense TaxID=364296 RepID=A0ABT3HBC8_9HYPH|nr:ABC transporter ATP-binding protein [Rhodobium gokarnense]MCW2307690.1 iron complex transport system ATP-binding protein [Rhodobium gokarnense]